MFGTDGFPPRVRKIASVPELSRLLKSPVSIGFKAIVRVCFLVPRGSSIVPGWHSLFAFNEADRGRFVEGENDNFFSGHGADVVVQADHVDASAGFDHGF